MKLNITTAVLAFMAGTFTFAQGKLVDQRDQAEGWYVPIHGHIMANGKKLKNAEIIVYKDNQEIGRFKGKRKGRFELALDIDQMYSIRIVRHGFQEKLLYVDTALPKDLLDYPDYECYVNMSPTTTQHMDPFYTDFPSAIVRYDANRGGFYHSEGYLTHIQTKLSGYAKVSQ